MFLLPLVACAPPPEITGDVSEMTLRSEELDDELRLLVRTPPDGEGPWPLVLQLDPTFAGLDQFEVTAGLISARAAVGDWPEAVVVGLDYAGQNQRFRDFSAPDPITAAYDGDGVDATFRALRDEVLPHVDAELSLTPDGRVLVGHSLGAVFAMYTALRAGPEAPLFDAIVAADAGFGAEMFTWEGLSAERAADLPVRWYASRAVYNGATQQIWHDAFYERLEGRGWPGLTLRRELLDTDHGGAVRPSYEEGLDLALGGAR